MQYHATDLKYATLDNKNKYIYSGQNLMLHQSNVIIRRDLIYFFFAMIRHLGMRTIIVCFQSLKIVPSVENASPPQFSLNLHICINASIQSEKM